jgi:tRNA-Thr(GGU) m(6)t(6)A37 methyltransferase TsaA
MDEAPGPSLTLKPIGVVRSTLKERLEAPRQPRAAAGLPGTLVLEPGHNFDHALEDIEQWEFLWLVFWFHLNSGWRPKVSPPRSSQRRGVFATRSPYRPNPIGLSVVRLVRVNGLSLELENVDLLDGTPILDIKPYVAYTDSIPDARDGWLGQAPADPDPGFELCESERFAEQLAFLRESFAIHLHERITAILKLGPEPHPYRRIKRDGDAMLLAFKDWRVRFVARGRTITLLELCSGYRPRELVERTEPELDAHRAFVARFGSR